MHHVYTARVRVCHHELDAFGRVYPAAYLRHLAAVAVDASTAAGFDARWYASHGVHWLVRRTTFDVLGTAAAGTELEVRTWVEDFRRVRSQRRYTVAAGERAILDAVTDWVLVESATGRLRRVPQEMAERFGTASGTVPRAPWSSPPPPPRPLWTPYVPRYSDLDSLMHVNNATYLDVLTNAALDVLGVVGWTLERLLAAGAAPVCVRGDLEYLDAARFGDRLAVETWFTPAADELGVHQRLVRTADDPRPLVQCTTTWRWLDPTTRALVSTPAALADAVGETEAA